MSEVVQIKLPYNFSPRSYQREVALARQAGKRYFVTVWHRRSGKDKFWINFTIAEAAKRIGTYFYVLPTYKQAKKVIWNGIDRDGHPMLFHHIPPEMIESKNETDLLVKFTNGSILQLLGSDTIDSNVGTNPVGLVFSEFSIQSARAWPFLRPALAENGGWAAFNFTPRGTNHAYDIWTHAQNEKAGEWFSSMRTVDETRRDARGEAGGRVTEEKEIEEDRKQGREEDFIQQEYYCSFKGVRSGSYYGHLINQMRDEDRIGDVPWDPSLPVFTAWDLGIADATAIVFAQWRGMVLNIIDYLEVTGKGLADIIPMIRGRNYTYSNHYAPHDIRQREYTTGRTRIEAAQDLGINFRLIPNIPLQDGIDSARRLFGIIRMDRRLEGTLIKRLSQYHKEYDEDTNMFSDKPVHDDSEHGASAFRYLSLIFENERPERQRETTVSGLDESPYRTYGVDEEDQPW